MPHVSEAKSRMGALDAGDADPGRRDERRSSGRGDAPDTVARERLLQLTSRILGVPGALLILGDAGHQSIASSVLTPALATLHTPAVVALCQHTADADRPLLVADVRARPRTRDAMTLAASGVRAYARLPLVAPDGAALGTLCVLDTRTRDWTAGEAATLADLAAALAALVGGGRMAGTLRAGEARLLALHGASVLLAAQRRPAAVLEQILQQAVTLLGAGSGTFYRWDADAGLLRCLYNWRVPAHDGTPDQRPGEGLAGQAFARQAALIVNDYQTWAWAMPSGLRAGLRAALCVPLIRSGVTLGVIVIRAYERGGGFTDDDARLLGLFADQGAIALENAGLYATAQQELGERARAEAALRASEARFRDLFADAERQAGELRLLDRVRTALAREVDPEAVVRVVVEAIAATFGYTQVSLYRREGAEHILQHQVGYDHVLARIPVARGVSGRAVREGRALLIADVAAEPAFLGAIGGVTSEICVPLLDDGGPAGFLNVESTGGVRLDDADLRLMAALGEQVSLALERARLYADLREREARLAHQASHDPLTGLPNRTRFRERLERALGRARRDGRPCAVLFLDLDRFKQVNDTLGHAAGDQLLVAVAARLQSCLRDADTLARLGGDEFALLLEEIGDLAGALRIADRLLAALAPALPVAGRDLVVAASLGVALSTGLEDTPADLLRFADVALYRAKDAGGGGYAVFSPDMDGAARAQLELEHDLRGALGRDELRVHYQPLLDLATGRVVLLEALVRWQHPARGLLTPGAFIPLAEETGLIVPLGRWILAEACRQFQRWPSPRPAPAALAVNLSLRQFRDPALVADVAAILAATGLPADRLVLEVTETVAMERVEETIATMAALRALGVGLALDDFGTGYSSLAYLQRLPLDTLKIDRTFFRDTAENRAIVGAVVGLAHGLGLGVTAEGLETAAQASWARDAGCDRGQGYYFARPLPPEELVAHWAAGRIAGVPGDGRPARGDPAAPVAASDRV
jgi:diguanylate cyclase (GGDEF)-like protein